VAFCLAGCQGRAAQPAKSHAPLVAAASTPFSLPDAGVDPGPWLVRFAGGGVRMGELRKIVDALPPGDRALIDRAQLHRMADDLGVEALLLQEAQRRGLAADPEVVATGRKVAERRLVQDVAEAPALSDVPDEAVQAKLAEMVDAGAFFSAGEDDVRRKEHFDNRPDQPAGDVPRSMAQAATEVKQAIVDARRRAAYAALLKQVIARANLHIDDAALDRYVAPPSGLLPGAMKVLADTQHIPPAPPKRQDHREIHPPAHPTDVTSPGSAQPHPR